MATIAGLILFVLAVRAFGVAVLLLVGRLLVLVALALMVWAPQIDMSTKWTVLAVGCAAWTLGHWGFALKYKGWRTSLGMAVFSIPPLHLLAPIETYHRPRRLGWAQQ